MFKPSHYMNVEKRSNRYSLSCFKMKYIKTRVEQTLTGAKERIVEKLSKNLKGNCSIMLVSTSETFSGVVDNDN